VFREGQPWLSRGRKLRELDEFCEAAIELSPLSENSERNYLVDDILIGRDNWIITIDKQEINLGPVGSTIFCVLAFNEGQVVSRERLTLAALEKFPDPSNLTSHINKLRHKLGAEYQNRVRTIPGEGYMYVSPRRAAQTIRPSST
jgi:DNA-binding winged helix-turn-helix (wHTH) protein